MSRAFDVIASAAALVVFSPVLLVASSCIKLSDRGPVFFRAQRVGRDGGLFTVYKFRTMIPDAEKRGAGITSYADARITPVGLLLRRTKIDELPQLFNVLKGDMSLVGPRPEDPRYVALYSPDQRQVLAVRPGITSLASIRYRKEEEMLSGDDWETMYQEKILPDKLEIDLQYVRARSFRGDLAILFRTLVALFR